MATEKIDKWPSNPLQYEWKGTISQNFSDNDQWSVLAYCKPRKCDVMIEIKKYQGSRGGGSLPEEEVSLQSIDDLAHRLQLLSGIKHPNLLVPLHSFLHKDEIWTIYRRSSGGNLAELIKSHYPNGIHDEKLVATLLFHVVNGIEYLHRNQMSHRSLRPQSIFFDQDLGITLLSEFNALKKIKHSKRHTHQSDTLIAANREPWTDPLILFNHPKISWYQGDIFSIGITALHLVFGAPPIYSESLMRKIMLTAATTDGDNSILYKQIGPEMYGQEPPIKSAAFKKFIGECTKGTTQRITAPKLQNHPFFNPKNLYSPQVMKSKIGHLFQSIEMKVRSTYTAPKSFPNVEESTSHSNAPHDDVDSREHKDAPLDQVQEETKKDDNVEEEEWNFKTSQSSIRLDKEEMKEIIKSELGPVSPDFATASVQKLRISQIPIESSQSNHESGKMADAVGTVNDVVKKVPEPKLIGMVNQIAVPVPNENMESSVSSVSSVGAKKVRSEKSGRQFEVEPCSRELSTIDPKPPLEWDAQEAAEWIGTLGNAYKPYVEVFVDNGIDGEMLQQLDDDLLKEIIPSKLHRAKVIAASSHLFI